MWANVAVFTRTCIHSGDIAIWKQEYEQSQKINGKLEQKRGRQGKRDLLENLNVYGLLKLNSPPSYTSYSPLESLNMSTQQNTLHIQHARHIKKFDIRFPTDFWASGCMVDCLPFSLFPARLDT